MKIKVCGMTDADNIREVEALGIDMMGFIFYDKSPRFAGNNAPSYLPGCSKVGVFVNPSIEYVKTMAEEFGLTHVQLHGEESPEFCSRIAAELPDICLIKAFSITSESDAAHTYAYEGKVQYYLFDTATTAYGGSGKSFNWNMLDAYAGSTPFLLSGGISLDSIPALRGYRHPRWCGVDLNSRFETSPGIKNVEALTEFLRLFKEYN